jgi:hypothetical protein
MEFFATGSKAGIESPAELYKTERTKVLELVRGKTHLSFSTLTKIAEVRFPRDDRFSAPQGRYNLGKYYESQLTGEAFDGTKPSAKEAELIAKMVSNAKQNDSLMDWLESECVYKQHQAIGVVQGLRMVGYLDYFSDCLPEYKMGAENKTTSAGGLKGFLTACETWNYHAQVYIYTELLGLKAFQTFASSKANGKLIQLDYDTYLFERGRIQFEKLKSNLTYYKIAQFNV